MKAEPGNLMKQMQRDKEQADRLDKMRRLNRMIGETQAEISTLELKLQSYQSLHTDLEYLEQN